LWGLQVFGNQLKVTISKVHRAIDYKAATRSQNHEAEDPTENRDMEDHSQDDESSNLTKKID